MIVHVNDPIPFSRKRVMMAFRKQKRPTMRDVAELVGVSVQTVSAVINNKSEITAETRLRVNEAIEKLGYRPYSVARSLRTGKTNTISFIISDIANPSFAAMASSAEDYAHASGYHLMVHNTHDDPQREASYVHSVAERWIDGVLIVSANDGLESLRILQNAMLPVVAVERVPQEYSGPSVRFDNLRAGQLAAEYLLSLGHKRIAHISGPRHMRHVQERLSGFENTLLEANIRVPPGWIVEGNWRCEDGYECMLQILRSGDVPTALFASNDRMAIGAIQAISQAGLRVPDDISVMGLDDIEVSAFQIPLLTTIRQPFTSLATEAIQLLLKIIHGEHSPVPHRLLEPLLIERSSAAHYVER